MGILTSIKTYLGTYSGLKTDAPIWVNNIGVDPTQYSIVALPGARVIDEDIIGNKTREFNFAFQSVESTADELERLETIDFFELFSDWLDSQTLAGVLPSLGAKKVAESIQATNWAFLYQAGESQTGIYQIQCKLTYVQQP